MRKVLLVVIAVLVVLALVWIIGEQVKSGELEEIEKLWFTDEEEVFILLSGGEIPNCTVIKYYKCGEYPFPNNFHIFPKNCTIINSKARVVCESSCTLEKGDSCSSAIKNAALTKEVEKYADIYWKNRKKLKSEPAIFTLIEVLSNGMSDEREEILKNYVIKLVVSNYPLLWNGFDYTSVEKTEGFFSDPTGQRAEVFFPYWKEYLSTCDELKQACAFTELRLLGQRIPYNESQLLKKAVRFAKENGVTVYVEMYETEYISETKYGIKFGEQRGIGKKFYEKIESGVHVLTKPYRIYITPEGTASISPI